MLATKNPLALGLALVAVAAGCPKKDPESPRPSPAVSSGAAPITATPSGTVTTDGGAKVDAGDVAGTDATTCVDAWLNAQGLDRFGHPEGTMYTGGTPLFDEATGEQKDRLDYIFSRHPAAQKACPDDRGPRPEGGPATR